MSVLLTRRAFSSLSFQIAGVLMLPLGGKGSTKVKTTEKGVEFLAICSTRVVNDDRAAQISSQSTQYDSFTTKSTEVSEEYMKQLKANATIIYK